MNRRTICILSILLALAGLAAAGCGGGGTTDGDTALDGDTTGDGDTAADGETAVDGDSIIDGDSDPVDQTDSEPSDGETTVDGDTVVDGDTATDGDTTADGDIAVDGDTQPAAAYCPEAKAVFDPRCTACHAAGRTGGARSGAPAGVDFDTYAAATASAVRGNARIQAGSMPPGGLPQSERDTIQSWVDGGLAEGDCGDGSWPPEDPWWGEKLCSLPACDTGATPEIDLSGMWTQTLTAISHTCNPMIETFKPDIKPGAVTTNRDQAFVLQGECGYDRAGGTLTGVLRGDTMINCILMPPNMGVVAMPTGWVTFSGGTGAGTSTVHLYGVPVQPSSCTVEYDVAYARQ